jgi:CRISPR/Cas system-associated exonuclease Cas4 (RecB family)
MSRTSLKNVSRLIQLAEDEEKQSVGQSFLEDFKRSIEIESEQNSGLPSPTFKPSSLNCKRGCYYQIMQVQPDEGHSSFNMIGICNSGSDIHVRVQTAVMKMKEMGMDCEWIDVETYIKENNLDYLIVREKKGTETKLYDTRYGTYISFMCDGIIKYKGKYYILEIKTESSNKWYGRTDVDPKHHHQAISYSNSFKIDTVLFLYVERDLLNCKCYEFNVTNEMRHNLVSFLNEVQGYVERKIAPPKQDDLPKNICRYCQYQTQCKKDC